MKRVVFETGPLSVWFYHSLRTEGLPAICIDARHAKAALDMATNKTDANDADGLAQLAEVGFFREVRVKGFDSMLTRTLVAARTRLVRITTELSNQIRGVMKTFGLLVPAGKGSTFEKNVRSLLADQDETCIDRASDAGSLARHSHPRRRTRAPVGPGRAPKSGLPHPYVHSRHRRDHRNLLQHSH